MKAVIFDIDGTLLDSVDLHAQAWREAFQKFGFDFSFASLRSQIGKGGDQLLPVFLSKAQIQEIGAELEHSRGELFKEKFLPKVKSFSKVRALFERLLNDGWKLALASSAKGDELENYKRLCHITDLLDAQTSSDDAAKSKPHPDIFQAALKRLDLPPRECVVVGDSPYDAEAAGKAGIRAVGFLCGGFPAEDLLTAGCEVLYKGAAHLLQNYDKSLFSKDGPGAH